MWVESFFFFENVWAHDGQGYTALTWTARTTGIVALTLLVDAGGFPGAAL